MEIYKLLLTFLSKGLLLSLASGQYFSCTDELGDCEIGTFPDPESCAHYYYCFPGPDSECITNRQKCDDYLAFDWYLLQCALVTDVDCGVIGDSLVFAGVNHGYERGPGGNPLPLASIVTKKGNQWNETTSTFTVVEAEGIYFMGLSVSAPGSTPINYTMVLSGDGYAGITCTHTVPSGTAPIGRDVIAHLYSSDTVHVSSTYEVMGRPTEYETALSIYSISDAMVDNLVAFSVARQDSMSGYANPVTFEDILFTTGIDFDEFTNTFWPPFDGIYVISFSVGLISGGTQNFTLYKNFEPFVNIEHNITNYNGDDTIGRSVMMYLERDEPVYLVNPAGKTARSSTLRETSFCGFRYEPRHGNPVAWSVARTTSFAEAADPVVYPVVLVNVGDAWQPSSNWLIIPRSGYYFIHIGGGIQLTPGFFFGLRLVLNFSDKFSLTHWPTNYNGVSTISRCAIMYLEAGDRVKIRAGGHGSFSNWGMQTIFFGFLLY